MYTITNFVMDSPNLLNCLILIRNKPLSLPQSLSSSTSSSLSASLSPLLLRGAPDTARKLFRSFTPKRRMQLQMKVLPKVPKWWLKRDIRTRNPSDERRQHYIPPTYEISIEPGLKVNIKAVGVLYSRIVLQKIKTSDVNPRPGNQTPAAR